jgi:lauroyl/myristoyl acyltransferase
LVLTAVVSLLCILILGTLGLPRLDHGAEALRPRASAAYATLEQIKQHMSGPAEPMWLLIGGTNELDVALKLDAAEAALASARPWIAGFTLPTALWARPDRQTANRDTLASLVARRDDLKLALRNQGFSDEAFALTGRVFDTWARAQLSPRPFWPDHPVSEWILDRFISREADSLHALGLIYPDDEATAFRELRTRLPSEDYQLASWAGLGEQVLESVRGELAWLSWLMLGLILTALTLAFRRVAEVVFSVAAFCLAMAGLLAVMRAAGWSWNLMNLMALPLLLGTSVDYGIHIQLALRRHRGDLFAVRRTTGRALLLCGATTIAAFGSLGWSSNAGLASLGRVCAVGIACSVLTAVYLLPAWWKLRHTNTTVGPVHPSRPSRFYSTMSWRLGLAAARFLPESWLAAVTTRATALFGLLHRARFRVVVDNLMPLVGNDPPAARAAARKLFRNFGLKVAHLWTYEAGCDIDHLVGQLEGRDRFFAALKSGRGVLLVSPHLGNWELGAPLLAQHGVKLLAVTLEEPSRHLTELRSHSRRRWGIETIVIRRDPFSFLEVLRQLENGAAVALLIDRPPAGTAAPVPLFDRELDVSLAPAELARASGCVLLPVYVVHESGGYHASVLPEIDYDRRGLRQVDARHALTREIMRAFEPAIRNHPDQWYHFVPIWRTDGSRAAPRRSSSD